jgi:6-phosphogluconolactonase (cycloisomerase 2 family)
MSSHRLLSLISLALVWTLPLPAASQTKSSEYVYTSNFGDFTLSGFSVDTNTGSLTALPGSPFPTGIGPEEFAASRDGRFLYVSIGQWSQGGPCGNDLAQATSYAIAPATGELSQLQTVTLPQYCPSDLIVDASGKFVYVALIDFGPPQKVGAIAALTSDAGALTPVNGSPFESPIEVPPGQNPAIGALALGHGGQVLYASDPNDPAGILIFDRDTTTGALAFRTAYNSGTPFGPIITTPSGKYLIAAPTLGPGIYEYAIGKNGDLTPVPGSPFASPNNNLVTGIAISPNGKFVVISEQGGVVVERATSTGRLEVVPGSPFGGYFPYTVTFDPSGNFVYVPGTAFQIDPATGVLTEVSNFTTGDYAIDITSVKEPN